MSFEKEKEENDDDCDVVSVASSKHSILSDAEMRKKMAYFRLIYANQIKEAEKA